MLDMPTYGENTNIHKTIDDWLQLNKSNLEQNIISFIQLGEIFNQPIGEFIHNRSNEVSPPFSSHCWGCPIGLQEIQKKLEVALEADISLFQIKSISFLQSIFCKCRFSDIK